MKWFTSDLHHSHKNIVKFTNRGVETAQETHDEWLRNVWNSQVAKGDIVYHLGDFSFAKRYEDIANFIKTLNGQKIFFKGNHDDRDVFENLMHQQVIQAWYEYKEIKIGSVPVVLFHFPIGSWHKQGHGSWHLHGHSHGNYMDGKGFILDVGIDNAYNLTGKHKFFAEEDIVRIMHSRDKHIADHHRENI